MEKNRETKCEALTLQKTPNQLSLLAEQCSGILHERQHFYPSTVTTSLIGLLACIQSSNRLGVELTITSVTHILWKGSRVNKAKISDRSSMKTSLSC